MQIPDSGKEAVVKKVGSAVNNDWAGTIRLKKTTPGLEYAFTYHKPMRLMLLNHKMILRACCYTYVRSHGLQ